MRTLQALVALFMVIFFIANFEIRWRWPESYLVVKTEQWRDCRKYNLARDEIEWSKLQARRNYLRKKGEPAVNEQKPPHFGFGVSGSMADICAKDHPEWVTRKVRWRWPRIRGK